MKRLLFLIGLALAANGPAHAGPIYTYGSAYEDAYWAARHAAEDAASEAEFAALATIDVEHAAASIAKVKAATDVVVARAKADVIAAPYMVGANVWWHHSLRGEIRSANGRTIVVKWDNSPRPMTYSYDGF
jgi:hypothetical protein